MYTLSIRKIEVAEPAWKICAAAAKAFAVLGTDDHIVLIATLFLFVREPSLQISAQRL